MSGDQLSQRVAEVTYIYRGGESGLTGQLGLGYVLETGKLMQDYYKKNNVRTTPKVILLYSFGWCF